MIDHRLQVFRLLYVLLSAVLLGLTGCARTRPQAVPASSTPPAPKPLATTETEPALPQVQPNLRLQPVRPFLGLPPHRLPHPTPHLLLLSRAEMLFEAGRLHYQAGETAAARRQFDLAVDTLIAAPERLPGRKSIEKKLAELVEAIHRYDLSGLGAGELPDGPVFDKSPLEDIPELTFPIDPKQRNEVIEELRATVSQLPLEVNDEVLRYIEYFSSGRGRRVMTNGLKKAGRYRHLIQRILDEEGVPQELIHLAQAESGFKPRAVSRRRAAGIWQFIRSRGREYGLIRARSYDERFDPEKSTRAAARHLRDLYTRFGDWYLAMAAYNSGPLNVARAVERTGYADFWELRRRKVLPRETLNYVPIILAMIIMAKNPAHYGLDTVEPDPPLEHSTVEVESPTHLALIADVTGYPVSQIRELNPALWRTVAPAGYSLRVPKGTAATVISTLEMVPASRRASWRIHRVGEGETLSAIARRYRTSAKRITELNQLDGAGLDAGNLLLIPSYRPTRSVSRRSTRRTAPRRSTASKGTSSTAKSPSKTSTKNKWSTASSKKGGQRPAAKTR